MPATTMKVLPWLAVSVLLPPLPALADTATVGGRTLTLTAPKGHCALEERPTESDMLARIRAGMGQRVTVLMVHAPCAEVKALRDGRAQDAAFVDYGIVSVLTPSDKVKLLDGVPRQRFVAASLGTLSEAMKKAQERHRGEGVTSLGVVDSDDNAAYIAASAEAAATGGVGATRSIRLTGVTLVRGLQATVTRIRPLTSADELGGLVREQKAVLAQFVSANP